MMNLNNSSNKPSVRIPSWVIVALLIISFGGFIDASFISVEHYLGNPIVCNFLKGCETVTSSSYATLLGMPVALFGALYYLAIFLMLIIFLDTKKEGLIFWVARFTIVGFLASVWFLYLQIFVIHALCLYCVLSALSSTLLFILGLVILHKYRKVWNKN